MHEASQVPEQTQDQVAPQKSKRTPRPYRFFAHVEWMNPGAKETELIQGDTKAELREKLSTPAYANARVRIFRGYELTVQREVRFH